MPAIANDGVYTKPRTWLRVEDSEGNVVMENETSAHSAMKETTAYLTAGYTGERYHQRYRYGGILLRHDHRR